jgi:AraC-like DNA-binding protein
MPTALDADAHEAVRAEYIKGVPVKEIAARHGWKDWQVKRATRDLRPQYQRCFPRKPPATPSYVRPTFEHLREVIRAHYSNGLNPSAIAAMVGCNRQTVYRYCRDLVGRRAPVTREQDPEPNSELARAKFRRDAAFRRFDESGSKVTYDAWQLAKRTYDDLVDRTR